MKRELIFLIFIVVLAGNCIKAEMQPTDYNRYSSVTKLNPVTRINCLIPSKDKSVNGEFDEYPYQIDVGINVNYLISSEILKKGYSGFGVFLEPYIGKYVSFKFKLNRWVISSINKEHIRTPFHTAYLWKRYYLLKLNAYPWNHLVFAQFGIIGQSKNTKYSGGIEDGGFSYGFGCHLFSYNKFTLSLTFDKNITGRFGPDGILWDTCREISIGVIYTIKGIKRVKK